MVAEDRGEVVPEGDGEGGGERVLIRKTDQIGLRLTSVFDVLHVVGRLGEAADHVAATRSNCWPICATMPLVSPVISETIATTPAPNPARSATRSPTSP